PSLWHIDVEPIVSVKLWVGDVLALGAHGIDLGGPLFACLKEVEIDSAGSNQLVKFLEPRWKVVWHLAAQGVTADPRFGGGCAGGGVNDADRHFDLAMNLSGEVITDRGEVACELGRADFPLR